MHRATTGRSHRQARWVFLAVLTGATGAQALYDESGTAGQALIGVAAFGGDDLAFQAGDGAGTTATVDISSMPLIGIAGQMPLTEDRFSGGIEGGVLFGWRGRDSSTTGGNGTAVVRLDVAMTLLDAFFGGFVNVQLGERSRLYLGAGPYMMFGQTDYERWTNNGAGGLGNRVDQTESSFGYGVYGRAGVETRVANGLLGVCGRVTQGSLDYDQIANDLDLTGVQGLLTFTVGW